MTAIPSGGFDIRMTVPALSAGEWVGILSDIDITPAGDGDIESLVYFSGNNGFSVGVKSMPSATVVDEISLGASAQYDVRVVFYSQFVIVYVDDVFAHFFYFDAVEIPEYQSIYIRLLSSINMSVANVEIIELSDWRGAAYMDISSTGMSGLSGIIQERPVEMAVTSNGDMDFSYDKTRDNVTVYNVDSLRNSRSFNTNAASDMVIYFSDVEGIVDTEFAESEGFFPSIINLANLEQGAVETARVINERAKEDMERHDGSMRLDPRIEAGDILQITATIPGTKRAVNRSIIVEDVNLQMAYGDYSMRFTGRKAD